MRLNIDEALRYLGAAEADGDFRADVEKMACLLEDRLAPRFVLKEFPILREPGGISMVGAGLTLTGGLAERMLASCHHAALLVCTLGAGYEALYRTWQARDMARAVMLDACGSAYVEAGCDEAERRLAEMHPGLFLTDRFSPGYGDLPLELQDQILQAADAGRRLGVQATASHLLIPSKTVTAVIGIADEPQKARIRGCAYCALKGDCALRKGGKNCE